MILKTETAALEVIKKEKKNYCNISAAVRFDFPIRINIEFTKLSKIFTSFNTLACRRYDRCEMSFKEKKGCSATMGS